MSTELSTLLVARGPVLDPEMFTAPRVRVELSGGRVSAVAVESGLTVKALVMASTGNIARAELQYAGMTYVPGKSRIRPDSLKREHVLD